MVFWDTVANNKRRHASQAPHEVAEAYIQPAPYRTDETVKSDLNRLILLVDDTQIPIAGQSYVRYPLGGGVALAGGSDRIPNRRPFYACCRDQNETVTLFCKVNAKRWCLLAEPSPLLGTTKSSKAL